MKIISESIDKTGEFAKSPAFKDYKYVLDEVNRLKANSSDSTDDDETYTDDFFANAEMVIRYGNFRKLGKGSSRTATGTWTTRAGAGTEANEEPA